MVQCHVYIIGCAFTLLGKHTDQFPQTTGKIRTSSIFQFAARKHFMKNISNIGTGNNRMQKYFGNFLRGKSDPNIFPWLFFICLIIRLNIRRNNKNLPRSDVVSYAFPRECSKTRNNIVKQLWKYLVW